MIEEVINQNAIESATNETKSEQVTQRRQRRDLRKKVRVNEAVAETNAVDVEAISFAEQKSVESKPAVQQVDENVVVAESVEVVDVENEAEKSRDNSRQRRLPRHLRVNNQRRRRSNAQEKSPMPLFAAVASPELASGKVWIDMNQLNQPKENTFLSVDELLEQQNQRVSNEPEITVPALDMIVEKSKSDVQPLTEFITQPANDSVEKKVQASLQRLNLNNVVSEPTATKVEESVSAPIADAVKCMPETDRTFSFSGRLGTFSSVTHTKAEMTCAKASEEPITAYPIQEWKESRYYFYGKGAAGHHMAISHVYSEPTKA